MADIAPATPAPEAPAAPSLDQRIGALKGEARDHWQLHGDIRGAERLMGGSPEPTPEGEPSTETPGAPAQAEAAQTEAAPGPATPKEAPKPRGDRDFRGLRSRLSETERENIRLKTELDTLKKVGESAATRPSAPAAKPVEVPSDDRPELKLPDMGAFKSLEDYNKAVAKAMSDWKKDDTAWVNRQLDNRFNAQKAEQAANSAKQFKEQQLESGRKEYKDYDTVAFNPKVPASHILLDVLGKHPEGHKIRYYLGSHLEDAGRIAELTHLNGLDQAIANWGRLTPENRQNWMFHIGIARGKAEAEVARIIGSLAKPAPRTETTTVRRLPRPSMEASVTPRAAAVADERADAIARGDQDRFNKLENERELRRAGRI